MLFDGKIMLEFLSRNVDKMHPGAARIIKSKTKAVSPLTMLAIARAVLKLLNSFKGGDFLTQLSNLIDSIIAPVAKK